MISRWEGYQRGAGKEEGGLQVAERFFAERVGVRLERITDPQANYLRGDLRSETGATAAPGEVVYRSTTA